MVTKDIIQRLLSIINDTRARLNTLESREVALLTATQTLTNKTLTTPTIGNFTNAQHDHTGATSGGTISHSSLTNLTTGDPHTQYLLESAYDANTILKADTDNTPVALTVGASTIVGRAAAGNIAALTASQVATIVQSSIDHSQLTNLTTGDPHTQYLLESAYDANTILKADADNTPVALTVGASTIVGRAAAGNIAALTASQVATIVQSSIDHGSVAGLADDDHTQYALLAGRSGGQSLSGGTAANDDLTLQGTTNATRTTSYVLIQPNGGYVGIGTTNPAGTLHLYQGTGTNQLTLGTSLSGGNEYAINPFITGFSNGGFSIRDVSSNANRLVIQYLTGYVGIGTTNPAGTLHLYQSTGINQLTLGTSLSGGNEYAINPFITGVSNGGFSIRDVSSNANRLVIEYLTGNVGIGTTSPGRKLHVAGSIVVDGDEGGIAGAITFTDVSDTAIRSSGVGTIKFDDVTDRTNAGFIKIYVGTTAYYVPIFATI